ncbi:hypothetical protein O7635_26000 [Asanoa sp. WMMD1127]|uniref:hypothetical protein n=1 Tax=Asanoa sp. WMMD1127 TaxID=3016107 RepID=UPI002416CDFA|nr:hypothetical protein [Asanoa sp. WMMD1127]MDG4825315.1 hypothetical protein [Asanoa sp. WMMD1127]
MNAPTLLRRRAGLVCLAVAPMLLLLATAADPGLGEGAWDRMVAADPDGAVLHTVLLHWAYVLFVPGFLAVLGPIRARGRVPATIAWAATLCGLATFAGLVLTDVTAIAVAATVAPETFASFEARVDTYTWMSVGWQLPGLVGWVLAFVLTPIAAVRARLTGWWYAVAALAGFGLYFLFAISPVPLSLTGPALLSVANVVLAIRLWRDPALAGEAPAWRATAGAVCLVAAPVALAVGVLTMPGTATRIDPFHTAPDVAQASAFFLHLGWLLFVPGVLAVTRRIAGRFGLVAGGVAVLGLLHWNGLMIGDYLGLAVEQTLDPATQDQVTAAADGYALFALAVALPAMIGALLGLILVPLAAARAGLTRWWAPALAALGVAAFLMLTTGRLTGLLAPALLLAAYGPLAWSLRASRTAPPAVVPAAA